MSPECSLTAALADLRRRSRQLDPTITQSATAYWDADSEMESLLKRYQELKRQQDEAEATYQRVKAEQAEIDEEADALQQHINNLEAAVKFRDESHRSRRRHKRIDRRIAAFHRNGDVGDGMSDAAHVKLVIKARSKARRDRDCDKATTRVRKARLRKQDERGLNPDEVLALPTKRKDREAYYADLAEARRIAIIAACTSGELVLANLNGECHEHYDA